MWVLIPLPRSLGNGNTYCTVDIRYLTACGDITVGRPLKKGSTVGRADILIFNEQSVSSIHAKLKVEAPAVQGSTFTHGNISITDISKFGTHLARSGEASSPETKLSSNQPVQLQPGDVLRFGSNSRFQLQQVPFILVASSSCLSRHPELQQQASALNAQLTNSWQAAAAAGPDADIHHVVDGEAVTPCLLRSLMQGKPLVTAAWVEAAAARKTWVGDLPPAGEYSPEHLLLPLQQQEGAAAGQSKLILSDWRVPGGQLLASFTLLFEQGCQDDLVATAAACGAQHEELPSRATKQQLVAQRQQAANAGRTAVLVHCSDWGADTVVQLQQQSQLSAAGEHLPAVSELQLLLAIVQHTAQPLQDAAAAFAAEHSMQEQPPQPAATGAAAAAGGGAGAVDDDEEADGTEADETEVEEEATDDPAAAAATPAPGPAAAAAGTGAGGRSRASPKGVPVRTDLRPASPSGAAAGTSTRAGLLQSAAGWHQHSTSTGTAHGHATGTKRTAAAAASSEAIEAPSSKRRRTAAGTSPGKAPLQLQQQPPPAAPGLTPQPAGGNADASRPPAAPAGPQGQQQQQQQDLGCSEQITVQLCLTTPVQRPAVVSVGDQQVPNFKAFRRRDQAQQQQQQGQQEQGQQQRPIPPAVDLVVADAQNLQGADIDTFLRDEKHRMERLRKADELFHANLKPSKAPPLTKPAARARKK